MTGLTPNYEGGCCCTFYLDPLPCPPSNMVWSAGGLGTSVPTDVPNSPVKYNDCWIGSPPSSVSVSFTIYGVPYTITKTLDFSGTGCWIGQRLEEKDSLSNAISIYPSPSTGSLTIENGSGEDVIAEVDNIGGITISKNIVTKSNKIQLNGLPEGMIIVQVYKQNHNVIQRKLIPVIKP